MLKIIILGFLFLQLSAGSDFSLNCTFSEQILFISEVYVCEVNSNFMTIDDLKIGEISGTHLEEKTNEKVYGWFIKEKIIFRIPKNLFEIFPLLTDIKIEKTPMRSLKASDMEQLHLTLVHFAVINSKLEIIEKDTFKGFNALLIIELQGNSIFYIDTTAFDNIKNALTLDISNNKCFDLTTKQNLTKNQDFSIQDFLTKIKASSCNEIKHAVSAQISSIAEKEKLDIEILGFSEAIEELNEDFQIQINNITSLLLINSDVETNLTTCEMNKLELDTKVQCLNDQMTDYEEEIKKLKEEISDLKLEIDQCRGNNGTCRFVQDSTYDYSCVATDLEIMTEEDKIEWSGSHLSQNENENVKALLFIKLQIRFIPNGIGETFNDLRSLVVTNCNLQKIEKINFNEMSMLQNLILNRNNLTTIPSGVFNFLTSLATLDLSENKISTFPSNIFANLLHLEKINVNKNQINSLRNDLIQTGNKIKTFEAIENDLTVMDLNFIWRLNRADLIDFTGNRCNLKYEKGVNSFIEFYSTIVSDC